MLKHNLRQINKSILTLAYVFIDSILLNKIRQEVFVKLSSIFYSKMSSRNSSIADLEKPLSKVISLEFERNRGRGVEEFVPFKTFVLFKRSK